MLVLVTAALFVLAALLAGAGAESRAATLPGPQAAHGSDFTLLIKPGGGLWSWGANGSGQLGNGGTGQSVVAARVGTATDWAAVACGEAFSLALKNDGSLWAWGANAYGQLGLGDTTDRTTPQRVGTASDWVAAAAGDTHALALKEDGSLWAWGRGTYGQLGLGDAAGSPTPVRVGSATDWSAISCGAEFSAALKADRTLWVWGRNDRFQLGLGDSATRWEPAKVGTASDWAAIDCGDEDMRALKTGGTLWAWGYNSYGQLGLGDQAGRAVPTRIGGGDDWASFACGDDHTAALKEDGSLWTWGDNNYGQLGRGSSDKDAHPLPLQVGTATDWSRILCGDDFTTALRPGGALWGWGDNTSGDLGLGDVTNRLSPELLFVLTDTTPPGAPMVTSSTHPDVAVWYSSSTASFSWTPPSDASGIAGYKWILDQLPATAASTGYPSTALTRTYTGVPEGVSYFHIRAVDCAGNWGPTFHRQIRVDTTPPATTVVRPAEGATYRQTSLLTGEWASTDAGAGVTTESARLDGVPLQNGEACDTLRVGDHALVVTATDGAGNQRVTTVHYTVEAATFTVVPSAGAHGSISPSTPQTVGYGGSSSFTVTPDTGWCIDDVVVDGTSVGPVSSYRFTDVKADHTIVATFAQAVPTSLSLRASPALVTLGDAVELAGELRGLGDPAAPVGLGGQNVLVQSAPSADGPWLTIGACTTSVLSGQVGACSVRLKPQSPTWYRLRYQPDDQSVYAGAFSDVAAVAARPSLGTPVVPRSARAGRWFSVSGSLAPRFPAGQGAVKVLLYRYRNGRLVLVKSLAASTADSGESSIYRVRVRVSAQGRYRFRATAKAPGWATATTRFSPIVTVR